MWEPEKEKINPQENEETKTSEGIETVAEGILEKKETDPVIEQETGSTNEQPVKIEPWCYNVQEAAKILGVSTTSMHEIIRKNNIHHVFVGRRILLPKKNFHEWLEKALSEPGKSLTR